MKTDVRFHAPNVSGNAGSVAGDARGVAGDVGGVAGDAGGRGGGWLSLHPFLGSKNNCLNHVGAPMWTSSLSF